MKDAKNKCGEGKCGGASKETKKEGAVKTEKGQSQASKHQAETERKNEPHQVRIAPFSTQDSVNDGLKNISDKAEDNENHGEKNHCVEPQPSVQVVSHEGPQHDPFPDGEIDDMHDTEGQGKPDGEGNIDPPDQNSIDQRLRQ